METKINLVNQDTFKQIYYSDEMRNKYIIKFDCNQMPPDLQNYTLLDLAKAEKIRFGSGDEIRLDCYTHGVIIESEDENFQTNIGGRNYIIAKGKKYIPKFPTGHDHEFTIKMTRNLKIYTSKKDSFKIGFFNSILKYMNIFLNNLVVINKNSKQPNTNGIIFSMGFLFDIDRPIIQIDENKFYYDYQEHHKDKNPKIIEKNIFLLDTLVQSDIIQILENNYKI